MNIIPSRLVPFLDSSGLLSLAWWRFLNLLSPSQPAPEVTIKVTASPFTYLAQNEGNLFVSGGTVSAITLSRVSTYTTGLTSGFIPVGIKDSVKITYSVLPTVTFLPS